MRHVTAFWILWHLSAAIGGEPGWMRAVATFDTEEACRKQLVPAVILTINRGPDDDPPPDRFVVVRKCEETK